MERIYIGTTLILLVSCVFSWWGAKKDDETIRVLREELYKLKKSNYDKEVENYELAYRICVLHSKKSELQRHNRGMEIRKGWEVRLKKNEKPSIANVMINREYELLENAESITCITSGNKVMVKAKFNEKIEHKHIYDTEDKVLYEIVKVKEHSMRGRDTDYVYELKKVS